MQWTRDGRELHFPFSEIFIACVIVWLVLHLAFNPLHPKSDLWTLLCLTPVEFTLSKASGFYSNARRFYSSKGDPLGIKGLKNYLP